MHYQIDVISDYCLVPPKVPVSLNFVRYDFSFIVTYDIEIMKFIKYIMIEIMSSATPLRLSNAVLDISSNFGGDLSNVVK